MVGSCNPMTHLLHHHQIYLEITESVPLKYNDVCHGILKEIRSGGVKLAVDDLGSGFQP